MQTLNLRTVPSHYGEVRLTQTPLYGNGIALSPIEIKHTYFNHLSVDVSIALRSGLKFTLPSSATLGSHALLCRTAITITPKVKSDVERLLSVVGPGDPAELQCMREALTRQVQANFQHNVTFLLEYPVTYQTLREAGGSIYHHEHDCVISLERPDACPSHPYSEAGRRSRVIHESKIEHALDEFGISISIVDSSGQYGPRYMNLGGTVYRIPSKVDWGHKDGIYRTSNYPSTGNIPQEGLCVIHYTFEEGATELGLYRTYEEALHVGDLATAKKEKLAAIEFETVKSKAIIQELKALAEIEAAKASEENQRLEAEIKRLDALRSKIEHDAALERQRLKDYYESRAYARKDHSEVLKVLPSIIIGIGSILLAVKTFFPPKR